MAEKKINGRTFRVGHVLATDAIRLQVRVVKLLGGAVDHLPVILAGVGSADASAKAASDAAAVAAMTDIVAKADPDEIVSLLGSVVRMSQVGTPSGSWSEADLDSDFTGERMKDLIPVVSFVLREVLGDFFGAALASGSRLTKTTRG